MAVSGATLTTISNILKNIYLPKIPMFFKSEHILLNRIKRKTRSLSGNTFLFPGRTQESQGYAPGSGTASLPTPGNAQFVRPSFSPKGHRARIRVFGEAMYASKNNTGAYVRAWQDETQSILRVFRKAMNVELGGDGRGALAYMPATDDQTTVTVSGYQGPEGSHNLEVGMLVDLIDASDNSTVLLSAAEVTAVDRDNNTVTLDSAPSGSDTNDYFVRTGSLGYAIEGLDAAINDTNPTLANYGGLDRSSAANAKWKSKVIDFSSGFTLNLLDQFVDAPRDYADGDLDFVLCRRRILRGLGRLMWEKQRFGAKTKKVDAKWPAVEYDGIDFVADNIACPKQRMLGVMPKHLEQAEVQPMGWMDKDGSIIHRTPDKEAYEAVLVWYGNLICYSPLAMPRAENVGTPMVSTD